MRALSTVGWEDMYNAPIITWDNNTYTPIQNKFIVDMIEDKTASIGLVVKNKQCMATKSDSGNIKGVIGTYDICTPDEEFGQRIMFRNSYDKSMSFAFVAGMVVWVCTNGCIKGDYQYKRIQFSEKAFSPLSTLIYISHCQSFSSCTSSLPLRHLHLFLLPC